MCVNTYATYSQHDVLLQMRMACVLSINLCLMLHMYVNIYMTFFSAAEEVNLYIEVHLRRVGVMVNKPKLAEEAKGSNSAKQQSSSGVVISALLRRMFCRSHEHDRRLFFSTYRRIVHQGCMAYTRANTNVRCLHALAGSCRNATCILES
jgi:hypothetical protein